MVCENCVYNSNKGLEYIECTHPLKVNISATTRKRGYYMFNNSESRTCRFFTPKEIKKLLKLEKVTTEELDQVFFYGKNML